MYTQWHRQPREFFISKSVPHGRQRFLAIAFEPVADHPADLLRGHFQFARVSDAQDLDRNYGHAIFQPCISEVQTEHTEESVEQDMNNLRGLVTAPHSRQSKQADQIINAALKALDVLGWIFE